jgi:hypothetical protein
VNRKESDLRQLGSCGDRPLDGVGNVMEFQIEKDAAGQAREPLDRSGALGREELAPDLEKTCRAIQSPR